MARPKVYDEPTETVDEAAQSSNGAAGWETAETAPVGFTPHRGRHKYENGICVKCGVAEGETRQKTTQLSTRRSSKTIGIDTLVTGGFFGLGMLLERKPFMLENLPDPPSTPVGRALQLEAAVAGKKIEKALRGTVVYKVVQAFLDKGGPWVEIAPIIVMPMAVGLASMRPDLAEKFRPMLIGVMLPILMEASKMADEQAQIMQMAEGATAEMVEAANNLVSSLLSTENGKSST